MNRKQVLELELDSLLEKSVLDDNDVKRAQILCYRSANYGNNGEALDPRSYRKTASTVRSPWFERYLRTGLKRDMTSAGADQKLVANEFSFMLNQAAKQHDELWNPEVTILWVTKTGAGARAGYPTSSIVNLPASKVSEAGLDSTGAPSITATVFDTCPSYRTVEVICSTEFLQDSAFDVQAWLADSFGQSFALGVGSDMVTTCCARCRYAQRRAS